MAKENPTWINGSYAEKILRDSDEDESIKVSNIEVKPATAKGDNYGSDMYRLIIDFSRVEDDHPIQEKTTVIVKVVPQDEIREELMESMGIFETELTMMSVTLPKMSEILQKVCSTSLSARSLYVQYEKPTHIVIEDLAPRGFQMANRRTGLDFDHCILTLRNLGIFHAASVALREKEPEALARYKHGMLHKDQPLKMTEFFSLGAKAFVDEALQWPELSPRITEKLSKISEVIFEKGCEAALVREDDFNVLNHGDFWVNNMLFRYDEHRKPIDHIFVDFQISNYGSPAVDILYFLGTSPMNEVRLQQRELVLREYHASLTSTMAKLNCNTIAPNFEDLQEILKNRAFLEVLATITVLPTVSLEKGQEIDYEEMLRLGNEYVNTSYSGKTYRKIMTTLLPWYDSMGFLDV